MIRPIITLALSVYDRHVPFFDGTVAIKDGDLKALAVGEANSLRDGGKRHHRMLIDQEFDACEVSLSSYIMARSQGLPFTAIPVFPRRLFSQSHVWVDNESSIGAPKDLVGRKIGVITFQTTLSVQAKGDLQCEYGVPWRDILWHVAAAEPIEFSVPKGVVLHRIPAGKKLAEMLENHEIDGLITPRPPVGAKGPTKFRRLFADSCGEELRYFRSHGFFPIMHVIALKEDSAARYPWLPAALSDAFYRAQDICLSYYADPNWTMLAWTRHLFEQEQKSFAGNLWPIGLRGNRTNLDRFLDYMMDQGLLSKKPRLDELFPPAFADS